jgi:hypothetical protein
MRGRSVFLIIGLAVAGLVASAPGTAAALDKGKFHDVFTNFFDCEGTPVQEDVDLSGSFLFNQRGSATFPYYRESVHGTFAWTNLNTGGTFTQIFTANSNDHVIVDNGDGTITVTFYVSGGNRFYDRDGNLVLRDPGQIRFAVDIDYAGTPGDPNDDTLISDFRVVRDSTGRNDLEGRDFCADLVEFTS